MRISKELSPSFDDSIYRCIDCNEKFGDSLSRNIDCPKCGGDIWVYATINGNKRVLKRKYVRDINKGDSILLRDLNSYEVLDIQELYDEYDIYKVALKGYRVINLRANDWVDIIWGSWK